MKMNKRMLKVAVVSALTVAFAVPAFANPFTDVPVKHWSYDAVNKLAQAGIVDGYGDGTFKGDKTVTRYEMAQMVAKAMTKSLNADQKATVDQLSKEFATELNSMGVKVEGLQKQIDNQVKISGNARLRHLSQEGVDETNDFRARVSFDGKINDDMKFNARLTSGNMNIDGGTGASTASIDTANVTFNALGLTNTIGRQDVYLGEGNLFDTQMNAFASKIGGFKVVAGSKDAENKIYAAEYGTNLLGANVVADYYKNDSKDQTIFGASASMPLSSAVSANASYYSNNDADATAVSYGVKFNKVGLSATYKNVDQAAYTGFGTISNDGQKGELSTGFKGMEYQYDKAIAKNTALMVKYQDFQKKDGTDMGGRTTAVVNVKF
ncbi:MAG: omp-alpha 3 [Firmicutes bacterium]|nr:omp-alpha 3 [Bacillota bacterium]